MSRSLGIGRELVQSGERDAGVVIDAIRAEIAKEPLARLDYAEAVDWNTLNPVESIDGEVLVAIAVYIGKTRLIDNFIIQ